MGDTFHNTVMVTCFDLDLLFEAHQKALSLLSDQADLVTDVHRYSINNGGSFAILPSGAKNGHAEDQQFRRALVEFTTWLDKQYIAGTNFSLYAQTELVREDDRYAKVLATNATVTTHEEIAG